MSAEKPQDTGGLGPQYQTYERQKCFIAYTEQVAWSDDLLSACQEVLSRPEFNLEPDYARKHFYPDVPLRQKALGLIANARYGIYDLSYWRDEDCEWQMPRNVFIELGMAIALNRPTLLLRHASNRELESPACLKSVSGHILEFSGETTLKRALEERLPQWVDVPPERDWWNRYCIFGGRVCEYREVHPRARQWGQKTLHCHISDGPDVDRDDFRSVIEDVLGRFSDVTYDYLDALPATTGYDFLLCTHCQTVRSTPFAIYRITPRTPAETFVAVGMSIALEMQFEYKILKVLLTEDVQDIPSLLSGYEVVVARSDRERKDRLHTFVPTVMKKVRATAWKPRPLPFEETMREPGAAMPEARDANLEDLLHSPPARDEIEPPVISRPQVLPFNALSWENFERLCTRLVASGGDVVDCHRYDRPGDYQAGIDILAHRRTPEGGLERWGYQCKRLQEMTPGNLRRIVDDFSFPADRYVVMISTEAGTDLRNVVADLPEEVDLWDAEDMSRALKGQPELVEDFFGSAWRDVFCTTGDIEGSSVRRLEDIHPGVKDAKAYEQCVFEMLCDFFAGQLSHPARESKIVDGTEHRHIIFFNASSHAFWRMVDQRHTATNIVFECKNTRRLKLEHVNQLVGYLGHALGNFGVIVSRLPPRANMQRKAITAFNRDAKVVLFLSDEDLAEMARLHAQGGDPTEVIERKYVECTRAVQ